MSSVKPEGREPTLADYAQLREETRSLYAFCAGREREITAALERRDQREANDLMLRQDRLLTEAGDYSARCDAMRRRLLELCLVPPDARESERLAVQQRLHSSLQSVRKYLAIDRRDLARKRRREGVDRPEVLCERIDRGERQERTSRSASPSWSSGRRPA